MNPTATEQTGPYGTFEELVEGAVAERDQAQIEMKEIELLIRQSTGEVDRLAQRNAQLVNKVRQMEMNIDTYPRHDIRELYTAAQEAQMRLFMMRGQVEQLQARQQNLERYLTLLERLVAMASGRRATRMGAGPQESPSGQSALIVRIIEAQETERQRLARQMHDGPAQSLTNLILQAEVCERLLDSDPGRARGELGALKDSVNLTFQRVREFISDLRPMMLDDLGLVPTLRRYLKELGEKTGLRVDFSVIGKERRLPPYTEVTIFRVVQALLRNIQEGAQATEVHLGLDMQGTSAVTTFEDNGSKFDFEETLAAERQKGAVGLAAVKNQIELLGGHLQADGGLGRGTRIVFDLPIDSDSTFGP